jgi:signal peptidase I
MSDRPASTAGPTPALAKARDHPGQIKETLISLVIAFIMAFVFRAFVAEAFIIPTGSMAPTLLGENIREQSPSSGYSWPVNPPQTGSVRGLRIHDPMTGQELTIDEPRRAGDRILVFKYLYQIYDPRRWDVVVFKAPHDPQTNYIKRLTGLPGEQLAFIDGDLFVRRPPSGETDTAASTNLWKLNGWKIQRKPQRVQRTIWQDVFWSQHEPLSNARGVSGTFKSPWVGNAAWQIAGRRSYEFTGNGQTVLRWSNDIRPIDDRYPYNELGGTRQFPVSDLNMAAGIEPRSGPVAVSAVLQTRGHEFRADIDGRTVTLRMGRLGERDVRGLVQAPTSWTTLGTGVLPHPLSPGRITNLEFWHADQSVKLWADGALIASSDYDWRPDDRLRYALGLTADEAYSQGSRLGGSALADPSKYSMPRVSWEFSGGAFTLHRVGLQRDIHYQAVDPNNPYGYPGRATSPLATFMLGPDHFFVCGDNSPQSLDARSWGPPDPWVAKEIDPSEGVVPRDLLIGRAFFVYFPALSKGGLGIPVPDFGRLRWIW